MSDKHEQSETTAASPARDNGQDASPRRRGEAGRAHEAAIALSGVRFSYDGERSALDGVDLDIPRGQFVAVVGSNGSGKSTLAKLVSAQLLPIEGTVLVGGLDAADPASAFSVRAAVGLVMQNPDDQIVASIVENDVAFGPENLGIPVPELRERVENALAAVGMAGMGDREASTLSGGQKQRVAIAGALAMRPDVLVLDEATALLDPRGRADVMGICRRLRADGMTVLAVTHFMEEAALADRVVVLDSGRVRMDGTPTEVFSRGAELASLGLEPPFALALSQALAARGIPLRPTVSEAELEEGLCALLSNR